MLNNLQLLVLFLISFLVYSQNLQIMELSFQKSPKKNKQFHISLMEPQTSKFNAFKFFNKTQQFPIQSDGSSMKITITFNGLPYKLNLDTGSANLVIKGQQTSGIPDKKYKCSDFSCSKFQDHIYIGYLDGGLKCYATNMNMTMGENQFNIVVLVAYEEKSAIFEHVEGIFGLAFPNKANYHPTAFQSLRDLGLISKLAYGINLNLLDSSDSFLTFGQPSSKFYEGELDIYDILPGGHIKTKFKWIKFGKYAPDLHIDHSIFDTGSTSIVIPSKYSQQILQAFQYPNTPNRCQFSKLDDRISNLLCRIVNFDDLPIIQILVDQKIYTLSKQNYILYCLEHDSMHYCDTHIEIIKDFPNIILGAAFFCKYYGYFDLEDHQLGLARNKEIITLENVLNRPLSFSYNSSQWQLLNY